MLGDVPRRRRPRPKSVFGFLLVSVSAAFKDIDSRFSLRANPSRMWRPASGSPFRPSRDVAARVRLLGAPVKDIATRLVLDAGVVETPVPPGVEAPRPQKTPPPQESVWLFPASDLRSCPRCRDPLLVVCPTHGSAASHHAGAATASPPRAWPQFRRLYPGGDRGRLQGCGDAVPPGRCRYREVSSRVDLVGQTVKAVSTRLRLQVRQYRDLASRVRLAVRAYRDLATRVLLVVPGAALKDVYTRVALRVQASREVASRLVLHVRRYRDSSSRVVLWGQNFRDVASRLRLVGRGFRDVASRVRLQVLGLAYKDVSARYRLAATTVRDVASRFRVHLRAYRDVASRVRIHVLRYRDIASRVRVSLRAFKDVASRVLLSVRVYRDLASRVRVLLASYRDVAGRSASRSRPSGRWRAASGCSWPRCTARCLHASAWSLADCHPSSSLTHLNVQPPSRRVWISWSLMLLSVIRRSRVRGAHRSSTPLNVPRRSWRHWMTSSTLPTTARGTQQH